MTRGCPATARTAGHAHLGHAACQTLPACSLQRSPSPGLQTLGVDEFSDMVVDKFLRGQFAPDSEARNLKVAAEEIYGKC